MTKQSKTSEYYLYAVRTFKKEEKRPIRLEWWVFLVQAMHQETST